MFTANKKPGSANIVWDATKNRPLCKFVNGVFTTNSKDVAYKLKALGYKVTGKADEKKPDPGTPDNSENADDFGMADTPNAEK